MILFLVVFFAAFFSKLFLMLMLPHLFPTPFNYAAHSITPFYLRLGNSIILVFYTKIKGVRLYSARYG